jgi:acetyltransferase-like isoleucine patch superfamily enzyme
MNIIDNLKKLAVRIVYPNQYSSQAYVKYLRKIGCDIGEHTHIFSPTHTVIDAGRPYSIVIGDYCKISSGVIILTHDYSRSVLRLKYKEIIAEAGSTRIGDNVFIGMNAIILKGVSIGNNVIIGAGSVVSHDIPDNMVAAGNPAEIVMTLDQYFEKRKVKHIIEAKEYAKLIYRKTGRKPTIPEMQSFFPLYLKRDLSELKKYNLLIKFSGDNYEDTVKCFLESEPIYNDFDEFLKDCGIIT